MKQLFVSFVLFSTFSVTALADQEDVMNIRVNLAETYGYGLLMEFKISKRWTLGPELTYRTLGSSGGLYGNVSQNLWGLGARANWFKNGAYTTGLYLGSALSYQKITINSGQASVLESQDGLDLSAAIGYAWFWDSFNIMVGAGYQKALQEASMTHGTSRGTSSSTSSFKGNTDAVFGEFSLGWTF